MKPIKFKSQVIFRRAFFRRHGKWVSFVGAIIVFLTFVVKEGVRENLKELIASISSAEDTFATRGDTAKVELAVNLLANKFDASVYKLEKKLPKQNSADLNTILLSDEGIQRDIEISEMITSGPNL